MKTKICVLIMVCSFALLTNAQRINQREKKGYISFTTGLAIPIGNFASKQANNGDYPFGGSGYASPGLSLNLVKFGYTFGKHFGITSSFYVNVHDIDREIGPEPTWSYGGLFFGPMVSLPVSEKVVVDVHAMIGFMATIMSAPNAYTQDFEGSSTGLDVGATLRFNFTRNWCLISHVNYVTTHTTLSYPPTDETFKQKIDAISINFGIGYRL